MFIRSLILGGLALFTPLVHAAPGDAAVCQSGAQADYDRCFATSHCPTPNGLCQRACHKKWQTQNAACPGIPNAVEERVRALVSAERRKVGIKYIIWDNRLGAAAQGHAANMAAQQKMEHALDGRQPGERVLAERFAYSREAENIYRGWGEGFVSPEAAMTWWMNSPGHRANILDARLTYVGVGARQGTDGKWYFSQSFAAP
jgi:uncharacterized protein YkwD